MNYFSAIRYFISILSVVSFECVNAQPRESIVGNTGKHKPLTIDYETNVDSSFTHEAGTVMHIKTSPALITKANFIINTNNLKDSLRFRINIYNLENGKPGSKLLSRSIPAATAMKSGTFSVDLKSYGIVVDNDFFLCLEWTDGHLGDKIGFGGGFSGNKSYHRIKGQSEWEKAPMKLGFYANVESPASLPPKITFNVQKRVVDGSDFKVTNEKEEWDAAKTAIIICDMWDEHWCKGASTRVAELAPHMNRVLGIARNKGMLIVHSPSDCMKYYQDYPQRKAAQQYAKPDDKYEEGRALLPTEKNAVWPIDQSNGGCNDTPRCEERYPWAKETDLLEIKENDVITDSGPEMVRMFKDKGIDRVILMGVHTNMCVVARPFGLRNMVTYGMNVALMRDLTDVMYDSRQAPFVNHFNGLGLMVEYIEKYIAPTVVSTDLTGAPPFRFKEDPRKN